MTPTPRRLATAIALLATALGCGGDDESTSTTAAIPTTASPAGSGDTAATGPPATASQASVAEPTNDVATTLAASTPPTAPASAPTPTTPAPYTVAPGDREQTSGSVAAGEIGRVEVPLADGESFRFRIWPSGEGAAVADLAVALVVEQRPFVEGLLAHPEFLASLGVELPTEPSVDNLITTFDQAGFFPDPAQVFSEAATTPLRDGESVIAQADSSGIGSFEAEFTIGIGPGPAYLLVGESEGTAFDYEIVIERGPEVDLDDRAVIENLGTAPFFDESDPFYGS